MQAITAVLSYGYALFCYTVTSAVIHSERIRSTVMKIREGFKPMEVVNQMQIKF